MGDLFTDAEQTSYLFKKSVGKPFTSTSRQFFQEPDLPARPLVYQDDIVSFAVPTSAPADIRGLGDSSLDDNGRILRGSYAGRTSTTDPNIRYYHKVPLEFVAGTGGAAWQTINATTSHPLGFGDATGTVSGNMGVAGSYGRVLQGSIPFNQDPTGTYLVTVYKDTFVVIPSGPAGGTAVIDTRAGTLVFHQFGNLAGVGESNRVYVSFFRYVGTYGGVSSSAIQNQVETTPNDFSVKQTFTGGVNGATDDSMTAIQIDTRDVASLSTGALLDALQIGGNFNGSWRFSVAKTATGSALMVQARESGSWVTKALFSTP
jgi:hypothetical protein